MRWVVFGFLAVAFVTGNESLRAQGPTGIAWDILEKGCTEGRSAIGGHPGVPLIG
jgi:hypothetical protein